MDDLTYGGSVRFINDYPPEYVEETKRRAVEKAWLDILHKVVLPNKDKHIVVSFYDLLEPCDYQSQQYSVRFQISFAQSQRVVIPSVDDFSNAQLYRSAVDEVKHRIKNKLRKLLHK